MITAGFFCSRSGVFLVPAVFGALGVAAGMLAVVKDARWLGTSVVTLSVSGAVARCYWASLLLSELADGGPTGWPAIFI